MNLLKGCLIGAAAALSVSAAHAATNLVSNGGFETGDLTGWTTNGWFATGGIAEVTPDSGDYFASTGCVGGYCALEQDLVTTPGQTYRLSFAFNPGIEAENDADTYVTFGGTTVADMDGGPLGWTTHSLYVTANAASTALVFNGFQNPAWNGVDDVSVTVPEPVTWAMMLMGLGGAGAALRRRRALAVA